VLQNAPVETVEIQGLRLRPVELPATTAKFDLTLIFEERDGELAGTVEYATDLFDSATVERLLAHYEGLLTAALEAPWRRISELPLLTPRERHQLFIEWNDMALPAGTPAG